MRANKIIIYAYIHDDKGVEHLLGHSRFKIQDSRFKGVEHLGYAYDQVLRTPVHVLTM